MLPFGMAFWGVNLKLYTALELALLGKASMLLISKVNGANGMLVMTSSAVYYSMIPPLTVLIATSNS